MKAKQLFFLGIIALCLPIVSAQQTYDLTHFTGLLSEGRVPSDIQKSLQDLYEMDKERVREYNQGKMTNQDRVLYGSYQINKLMASGRVLYGDPLTQMVEKVADRLLANEPELRSQLRFYTIKSSDVNAFCTGQGMIFVNVGLIAQLQDESQLAYVLAHEIVHYVRKHNLEILTRDHRKDAKRSEDEDVWESDQTLRLLLRYHQRSHAMETEADTIGLARFYLTAGYSTDLDGVFDVLQYSALPFDEIPFDTTYFNTAHYKIPHDCFLDSIKAISARDDYDDSKSSHPNIQKRRTLVQEQLKQLPSGGKSYIVTSEEEFDRLRTLARFECIRMDLIDAEYANAFYSCYLLQQSMPDNLFLEKSRLQALYAISKYKTYQSVNNYIPLFTDYEGEIQQIYHFFHKIESKELAMLTLKELWKSYRETTKDETTCQMAADIGKDLFSRYNITPVFFQHPGDSTPAITLDSAKNKNLKYERIRKKKQDINKNNNLSYIFYDLFETDSLFDGFLNKCYKEKSDTTSKTAEKQSEGLFLYSPTYRVYDMKNKNLKVQKTETKESELPQLMKEFATQAGFVPYDFSDQAIQKSTNADSYNEFAHLNEWTIEFMHSRGRVPMALYTQAEMNRLNEKYNAGMMSLFVVENVENRGGFYHPFLSTMGLLSLLGTAPTIYNIFAHSEETGIYSMLVDTKQGKVVKSNAMEEETRDDASVLRSAIFQHFENGLDYSKDKKSSIGYLGKRTILSAGMKASFDYMHFLNKERTLLPVQASFGAEFVLPKNNGIALDFLTRKTFTDYEYGRPLPWETTSMISCFKTRINQVGLYYCTYMQNTPAPLGTYFRFGLNLTHYATDTTGGFAHLEVNNLHPKHLCVAFCGSFGRNYLFYDHIVLKIAVHYGFTFANPFDPEEVSFKELFDYDHFNYDDTPSETYKAKVINHTHNARSWVENFLGWEIGVGILL
ncbi:MAG: M48 family metallopeptidase [Bacteroidales bacterium]|nr:M48 family metallopeptidase [Bacteroidales bacterium]